VKGRRTFASDEGGESGGQPVRVQLNTALCRGGQVADRQRVDYRFLVRNAEGSFLVEQRAYFDVDAAGRICYMRVICSGYRSTAE
jgi:hypothetical protein